MDTLNAFLQAHYQYVLIAVGLLFVIGVIRGWHWMCTPAMNEKVNFFFLLAIFGEKGFRVMIGVCGFLLIVCGLVFLYFADVMKW